MIKFFLGERERERERERNCVSQYLFELYVNNKQRDKKEGLKLF